MSDTNRSRSAATRAANKAADTRRPLARVAAWKLKLPGGRLGAGHLTVTLVNAEGETLEIFIELAPRLALQVLLLHEAWVADGSTPIRQRGWQNRGLLAHLHGIENDGHRATNPQPVDWWPDKKTVISYHSSIRQQIRAAFREEGYRAPQFIESGRKVGARLAEGVNLQVEILGLPPPSKPQAGTAG